MTLPSAQMAHKTAGSAKRNTDLCQSTSSSKRLCTNGNFNHTPVQSDHRGNQKSLVPSQNSETHVQFNTLGVNTLGTGNEKAGVATCDSVKKMEKSQYMRHKRKDPFYREKENTQVRKKRKDPLYTERRKAIKATYCQKLNFDTR